MPTLNDKCATRPFSDAFPAGVERRVLGGRARINKLRADNALERRCKLVELLKSVSVTKRGWKASLAAQLGCHRATVGRDIKALGGMFAVNSRLKRDRLERLQTEMGDRLHACLAKEDGDE